MFDILKCCKLSEKATLYKNFVAFNLCAVLMFASYDAVTSTASTLNQTEGLGVTSQFIIYATQLATSIVIPQIIIEIIGFKFTLLISQICYLSFFLANIYPRWSTLIPTSILAGFGNSLFWTSLGIYLTLLSKHLSFLSNRTFKNAQTFLFGLFGSIFLTNYIVASLWIGFILETKEIYMNSTFAYEAYCGSQNCPSTKLPEATSKPTLKSIYALFGTLSASTLLSIFICILFVDDLKFDENNKKIKRVKCSISYIKKLFQSELGSLYGLLKTLNIWLLCPIAMFLGFELTFIWFEFNRGFVSCIKNVNFIGWVNILFGGCACIFSLVLGIATQYIGLQSIMILMLMTALGHCVFMLSWTATNTVIYVLFLMSATFAFTDCLATSQVRAAYGIYYPDKNAAYSALFIFETFGLIIGSILSIYVCINVKIYVFMFITALSLVTFLILDMKTKKVANNVISSVIENQNRIALDQNSIVKTKF